MKKYIFLLFILSKASTNAQQFFTDSLQKLLASNPDTTRVLLLSELSNNLCHSDPEKAFRLAQQGLQLSRQINYPKGELYCKVSLGWCWWSMGDYPTAIQLMLTEMNSVNLAKDFKLTRKFMGVLISSYEDQGDYTEALKLSLWALNLENRERRCEYCKIILASISDLYLKKNQLDSAHFFLRRALKYPAAFGLDGWIYSVAGRVYTELKNYDSAFQFYHESVQKLQEETNLKDLAGVYNNIASLFIIINIKDSSLLYARRSLAISQPKKFAKEAFETNLLLADIYENVNTDSTFYYYKKAIVAKDSLYSQEKQRQILSYKYKQDLHQQEIANEKKELLYKQEREKEALIKKILIAGVLVLLLLAFIIVRNISLKRRNEAHRRKLAETELQIQKLESEKSKVEMQREATELQIKAMVATQEQERKRISRDLHDDVGTKLSALNLFLSSLQEKATVTNNDEIKSLACSSKQFIKETMYDVRQLLLNLSPTVLEEFGYTTAVEGLVNKINETKQIHFDLIVFGISHRLKKDYELALYRITQELINNVLKHAEAKHVSLQIGQRDEKIILMMEDDGKGFDVNAHKDGYGLNNLDARTKLMQGIMTIDSQPGKGTSVLVEVPYSFNGI